MKRLSIEQKQRLYQMYANGHAIREIARKLEIQPSNVQHHLEHPAPEVPIEDIRLMRIGQLLMKDAEKAAAVFRQRGPGYVEIVAGLEAMIRLFERGFMQEVRHT